MEGAHLWRGMLGSVQLTLRVNFRLHPTSLTGSQIHSGSLGAPALGLYMVACCAFLSSVAAQDQADNSLFLNLSNYSLSAHPKVGCSGLHMVDSAYAREKKTLRRLSRNQ